MSKKKSQQSAQVLSPEKYIKTKARALPIGECLIRNNWEERGMGEVIIPRVHKSGNITFGIYLIDTFCLGLKNSMYKFNTPIDDYKEILSSLSDADDFSAITYNEAHNLVYGVIEYAEELGFKPEKTFAVTQYILEEDTEEIPLIEYEFGKEGVPFLITKTRFEANKYISMLVQSVGLGNFDVYVMDEDEGEDEGHDSPYAEADNYTQTEYAYDYPDYPQTLSLEHAELAALFQPEYIYSLPKEKIDLFLGLPYDTLVADLEHIILFEFGKTIRILSDELPEEAEYSAVMHALFILGELKVEESLETMLEVIRQDISFVEYHFGDAAIEVIPFSLYYVGRNQLPKLLDYVKEPDLHPYVRDNVFTAVSCIAINEPDRRDEVIEWFRSVLTYYIENAYNPKVYDGDLAGILMAELVDIKAKELFSEIKELFDTNQIDVMCAGDYEDVYKDILSDNPPLLDYRLLTIYERYKAYEEKWGR